MVPLLLDLSENQMFDFGRSSERTSTPQTIGPLFFRVAPRLKHLDIDHKSELTRSNVQAIEDVCCGDSHSLAALRCTTTQVLVWVV